jgi:hypothetical protein
MSGWLDRIRDLWRNLWRTLQQSRAALPQPDTTAAPVPEASPPPEASPSPLLPWTTPQLEEAELVMPNRQMRRALERARRRRDKLVEPKLDYVEVAPIERPAPAPEKPKREKQAKKPEVFIDDPNDIIIADELVEGDGMGDVLFEQSEFYGEFNFRDSILDQLDRYWFYIDRMRRHDGDAYDFYRQLGAVLVPHSAIGTNRKYDGWKITAEEIEKYKREINLSPWFKQTKPSWGCIAIGTNSLSEAKEREHKIHIPRFMYFTRYKKPPPEIQFKPGDGDVYKFTLWWDEPNKKRKSGVPIDVPIFVSSDFRTIIPLKSISTRMVRVGRRGNNFDYHLIPQRAWNFPEVYHEWAADHGLTLEVYLPHLFCAMMREYEHSQYAMARVSVSKGDMVASFGINPRRLSYFFRDRDVIITVNGQRKPILQFVRPHARQDGTPVKPYFRGAREFSWAGYKVYVTIPGRDHLLLPEFNVASHDGFWWKKNDPEMITSEQIGHDLNLVVHGAPLRQVLERHKRA